MIVLESQTPYAVGGYAEVYRAFDEERGCVVALKVDRGSNGSDAAGMLQEFRALRLVQANVCFPQVYECKVAHSSKYPQLNGRLCTTMEFVEGQSMREMIASKRKVSERRGLQIARWATQALMVLHGNGLAHCDVHPGNILLQSDGLKLIDLGLSRSIDKPFTSGIVQTRYQPKESLNWESADIFSLALSLEYLVYGCVQHPDDLRKTSLGEWIAICTDPDPCRRFLHARDAYARLSCQSRGFNTNLFRSKTIDLRPAMLVKSQLGGRYGYLSIGA